MLLGVVATLAATACGGNSGESSQAATTTVVETTVTTVAPTTAPSTTGARSGTTRTTARATPTTARPATTVATVASTLAPTTTRALTKAEATQALCRDIETAVRAVSGGNTIGGGLRLTSAVNTYGSVADATVVSPARRMLSTALAGDLDASAAATQEAATACSRLGFPISIGMQCVTAPCP